MAEAFTIALIIVAHCVNEIIRATELLARRTRVVFRAVPQRFAQRTHPARVTSGGEPTPS